MPLSSLTPRQLAFILAPLAALTPFAIDTYLPALPDMAVHFNTDLASMGMTISIFLIGFALGQLIGGPLSDLWGRRVIALPGIGLFLFSSVCITQSEQFTTMMMLRFLQALGGGFATVIVSATVRDYFQGKDSARVFSMIAMLMMTAPMIAPAFGSLLLIYFSWQSIFVLLALYSSIIGVLVYRAIPKKSRSNGGHDHLKINAVSHFINSYKVVFSQRTSFRHLFAQSFVSAILFTFITNASFIFMGYYGITKTWFPLYFAVMVSSIILVNKVNLVLLKHFERSIVLKLGIKIQTGCTFSLLLLSVFSLDYIGLVFPFMILVMASNGLIFSNNMSMYLDYHGKNSGSANAVFSCATFATGALLGSITSYYNNGTLIPITVAIFLCSVLACFLLLPLKQTEQGA